jgi:hypothetical protein
MLSKIQHIIILSLISFGSTLLLWLPFLFNFSTFWNIKLPSDGMAAVVRNFDGPQYIVVAKSLYQEKIIKQFEFDLPVEYYAAHFPLYPLLVRVIGNFTWFPYAMLGVTVIFSILSVTVFYLLLHQLKIPQPFWLSTVFLFLPARWLVVRSIGSPEPLFIFLILVSIYYFFQKKYWLAGIAGGLAQLTKPPAILLFAAYCLYLCWQYAPPLLKEMQTGVKKQRSFWHIFPWHAFPIFLIPVFLYSLFLWYGQIYGSFWAYFQSGDNIHLFWPPFQMFNTSGTWVGTYWLEDIIWLLLIGAMAMVGNWRRSDVISWFTAIFYLSTIFISHRDLSRYSLPLAPFIIIAFAPHLQSKLFRYAFFVILIPIFLYSINFIAGNTTPISDWGKLL